MGKIYDTIIQAMDEFELNYQRDDEHSIVDTSLQSDGAAYHIRLAALEEQELVYCFSSYPLNVPEDKRPAMCELINAINFENVVGMLTLDPEDGQLVCRAQCMVDDGAINSTIVKVAIGTVFRIMNDNHNAFLKILAA